MLLIQCHEDDIMGNALVFCKVIMKSFSFRQWVACVVMTTVLFSTVAPLGICHCEGCGCANNVARFQTDFVTADKTDGCCCKPTQKTLSPNKKGGCDSQNTPCSCSCGDAQKSTAILSKAVFSLKRPDINPLWDVGFVSADLVSLSGTLGYFNNPRMLSSPHVPLHVLLCVFLN